LLTKFKFFKNVNFYKHFSNISLSIRESKWNKNVIKIMMLLILFTYNINVTTLYNIHILNMKSLIYFH